MYTQGSGGKSSVAEETETHSPRNPCGLPAKNSKFFSHSYQLHSFEYLTLLGFLVPFQQHNELSDQNKGNSWGKIGIEPPSLYLPCHCFSSVKEEDTELPCNILQ